MSGEFNVSRRDIITGLPVHVPIAEIVRASVTIALNPDIDYELEIAASFPHRQDQSTETETPPVPTAFALNASYHSLEHGSELVESPHFVLIGYPLFASADQRWLDERASDDPDEEIQGEIVIPHQRRARTSCAGLMSVYFLGRQ